MEIQSTQVCISLKSLFSRHKGIGVQFTDEPTSALDVTTQAQIVREMMELRDTFGTSIIIVTHNIGVAAYMADKSCRFRRQRRDFT